MGRGLCWAAWGHWVLCGSEDTGMCPKSKTKLACFKILPWTDHSPWKEGKKISYFFSHISFLYFMTQNQDLTLSFALQSGLGSWPVYLFWKLSLKKNVLQILSNQHTMKYRSPPIFFSWGLPQFLYHDSFWEDINTFLAGILKAEYLRLFCPLGKVY